MEIKPKLLTQNKIRLIKNIRNFQRNNIPEKVDSGSRSKQMPTGSTFKGKKHYQFGRIVEKWRGFVDPTNELI